MRLIYLILIVISIIGCKTDLTTQYVKLKGINITDEKLGRKILIETQKAVNIKKLLNYNKYNVKFNDCFYGFSGRFANPYKNKYTSFELLLKPKTFNSQLKFTSGKEQGKTYGIENNQTYQIINQEKVFKKDKRTKFWLPTYQYFIEFPLRILEADKITYAGESSYDNKNYDLVMVSWQTLKPQKHIDQYLIWVNKQTHRIDILQYTIRDMSSLIKGTNFLTDYKNINGIWFPCKMKVSTLFRQKLKCWKINKLMHQMEIESIEFIE
jgi:hypothetical protein